MSTVLITGATGYVGKHLVKAYLDQGYHVVASARTQANLQDLASQFAGRDLQLQPLDIMDAKATSDLVHSCKPDIIVHAAAFPRRKAADNADASVALEQTPLYKLNVEGMANIAKAAAQADHPLHLSVISSGAAFDQGLQHVDAHSPRDMSNPFAATKNLGEQAVERILTGSSHVKTSLLYLPVILDETQISGIIPTAARKAKQGERIENRSAPDASVNMITAPDLGRVVLGVTTRQQEGLVHYPVNGYRISTVDLLNKVADTAAKYTGNRVEVVQGDGALKGMPQADESALRSLMGNDFEWKPIDSVMEAIVSKELDQGKSSAPEAVDLMAAIRAAYPDITAKQLKAAVTNPAFLKEAYGPMPGYSTLSGPLLQNVKTATTGSFSVAYGFDTSVKSHANRGQGEPVIALIRRGDTGPNGEERFGLMGGYLDMGTETKAGEQPKVGAVREFKEEVLSDKGEPVIDPKPERLELITSGVDYRNSKLPVVYHGHALELNAMELSALKIHADRMKTDDAYKQEVIAKSNGEVSDLRIMPLSEVLAMPKESFTHPHEYDAVVTLAEKLKQPQQALARA